MVYETYEEYEKQVERESIRGSKKTRRFIVSCSQCGEDHEITVFVLDEPITDFFEVPLSGWGTCPVTTNLIFI